MSLAITSPAFGHQQAIPQRHTGDGEDLSPALSWSDAPSGAAEFALLVDDPDAPVSEPWVHWVLYKIPGTWTGLPEGFHGPSIPSQATGLVQGLNTWGTVGYRGPAPPRGHGPHHYHFQLYALDQALPLAAGLDKTQLLAALRGHVLAQGELIGTYQR